MLRIVTGTSPRTCDGFSRRDFLIAGKLALGGWALPQWLAASESARQAQRSYIKNRSVVLLYLSGGASHIETFDPKMDAPAGIRSATGEIQTDIPGVTLGGTFPGLSRQVQRLAIVRSFHHTITGHEQAHVHVLSGGTDPKGDQRTGFSMGSLATRLRGSTHPTTGMPTYSLLTEREVDGQYLKELDRVAAGSWPGTLGGAFAPLRHETGWDARPESAPPNGSRKPSSSKAVNNPLAEDMVLRLDPRVLDDRLGVLSRIDRLRRDVDARGTMESVDQFTRQALQVVLGGAVQAFDFRRESPALLERYDTFHTAIGHRAMRPSTLGRQMLVARRLCEAGCGFVTVHSAGWDMHADGNNPGIVTGMEMLGRTLDQAVTAFLEDVAARGLEDQILLVITGDFGRTPRINERGGRDHWAKLSTLAFAGGGLKMGQVVGTSSPRADEPASQPVSAPDLLATVMHSLVDLGQVRLDSSVPRDISQRLDAGRPIPALI